MHSKEFKKNIEFTFSNPEDAKKYYDVLAGTFLSASISGCSVTVTDVSSVLDDLVAMLSSVKADAVHALSNIALEG